MRVKGCDRLRGAAVIEQLFRRVPSLLDRKEGVGLIANVSDLLPESFLKDVFESLRTSPRFTSRQSYGELLTLIALRDDNHAWVAKRLDRELANSQEFEKSEEPVAVGIAFAAANLWDESRSREDASRILCSLIPNATTRVSEAIGTVFWAKEDFAADESTALLLRAFADHPDSLSGIRVFELAEHLVALVPHYRVLIMDVCNALLTTSPDIGSLYDAGPRLVDIAMTLQRFDDTKSRALSLLEDLLRLGLDDAFRILSDIDIRPNASGVREPRSRRRRRR